jgi:hypothetical protein
MRTVDEIEKDMADLDAREAALVTEIQSKEGELAEARESHRALLARYVGSTKKPPSLGIQRQRIGDLEAELEDLRSISVSDRRAELKRELRLVDAAAELGAYQKRATEWFASVHEALGILKDAVELGRRLEPMVEDLRQGNPIQALGRFISGLNDEGDLVDLQVDLSELKAGFYFLDDVSPLEKELTRLAKATKGLSDLGFGLRFTSLKNLPDLPPAKRVHSIQKDHQADPKGRFADDNWQARQLNRNQAAM